MSGFSTLAETQVAGRARDVHERLFRCARRRAQEAPRRRHRVPRRHHHVRLAARRARGRQAARRGAGGDRCGRGDRGVRARARRARRSIRGSACRTATSISATPAAAAGSPTAFSAIRPTPRRAWRASTSIWARTSWPRTACCGGLDDVLTRPLGRFQLKGRAEATPLAEVLALAARRHARSSSQLCARFAEGAERVPGASLAARARAVRGHPRRLAGRRPRRFYARRCAADPGRGRGRGRPGRHQDGHQVGHNRESSARRQITAARAFRQHVRKMLAIGPVRS